MKAYWVAFGTLLTVFFFLSLSSALNESLTFDEKPYIEAGIQALTQRDFSLEPYNPPFLLMLMTLPHGIGVDASIATPLFSHIWLTARVVNILLGVGILLATWFFATRYIHKSVALLSLIFLTFDPTLIAHSHYVTHDAGVTLFFLVAYAALVNLVQRPKLLNFIYFGAGSALAFASKLTSIPFLFLSLVFLLLLRRTEKFFILVRANISNLLLSFAVMAVVLWGSYVFHFGVVIVKDNRSNRVSQNIIAYAERNGVESLKKTMVFLQNQPLPLGDFLAQLKNSLLRRQLRESVFFFGTEYPIARPYFLPVMLFLKTSLPTLILIFTSLVEIIRQRKKELSIVIAPAIAVLISVSILPVNPQVRYALPIVPFLAILAGYGLWMLWRAKQRVLGIILVVWLVARTLSFFPHFIGFGNEFAGARERYYQIFSDSNIDWGQSLPDLSDFIASKNAGTVWLSYFGRDNPRAYGVPGAMPFNNRTLDELCDFYDTHGQRDTSNTITIISITNWYICGYYKKPDFQSSKVIRVVGDSFLVFE